ncbi:MAG: hypothetical protein WCB61_06445, partial [Pseudolabrys sp.]
MVTKPITQPTCGRLAQVPGGFGHGEQVCHALVPAQKFWDFQAIIGPEGRPAVAKGLISLEGAHPFKVDLFGEDEP